MLRRRDPLSRLMRVLVELPSSHPHWMYCHAYQKVREGSAARRKARTMSRNSASAAWRCTTNDAPGSSSSGTAAGISIHAFILQFNRTGHLLQGGRSTSPPSPGSLRRTFVAQGTTGTSSFCPSDPVGPYPNRLGRQPNYFSGQQRRQYRHKHPNPRVNARCRPPMAVGS